MCESGRMNTWQRLRPPLVRVRNVDGRSPLKLDSRPSRGNSESCTDMNAESATRRVLRHGTGNTVRNVSGRTVSIINAWPSHGCNVKSGESCIGKRCVTSTPHCGFKSSTATMASARVAVKMSRDFSRSTTLTAMGKRIGSACGSAAICTAGSSPMTIHLLCKCSASTAIWGEHTTRVSARIVSSKVQRPSRKGVGHKRLVSEVRWVRRMTDHDMVRSA